MQIRLRGCAREGKEGTVIECDCRILKAFLLLATAGWLMDGAWIFRKMLFAKAADGLAPSPLGLAIWILSAAALVLFSVWLVFGQRIATFSTDELRVDSAIRQFRVRRTRIYPLAEVCDVRLWFQGVNDGVWKTTKWSIVFDCRGRMIVLFPRVPEHAAGSLLDATHMHTLRATSS